MSKKKKKKKRRLKNQEKQIQLIHLHLDAIQNDLGVLFETLGEHLSKPVVCGDDYACKDPVDTGETVTTTTGVHFNVKLTSDNVSWISPETRIAALEEANKDLWEQLEDVEQEADEYARQAEDLRTFLRERQVLIDKFRTVLSRISNYQEDNPIDAAWTVLSQAGW